MVDAKLCAQHLLLKRMIQIDVGAICYLRVSTTRTWVRIADIGDETVDCVSVQFFASKRQTLCIHYWYAINQSTKMSQSKLMLFFSSATEKRKRDSDDSDESQPGPSTPKKTSRPRGFCDDWLVKYDWLYLENGKMKCHPCVNTRQNNPFSAGSGCTNFRNSTLVRHQKTSAHTDVLKGLKLQSDMKKSMKKAEHEQIQLQKSSLKKDQYVTLSIWKWPPKSTTWGSQWPLKIFLKGKPCIRNNGS